MRGRRARLPLAGCIVVLALLVQAATAAADSCPNAAFRVGASANLPDCRAYEMVSPADKNGYDITPGNDAATADGGGITYQSYGAFAGNPAGPKLDQYVSTRTASGWSTTGINIPTNPFNIGGGQDDYEGFSPDLTQGVVDNGDPPVGGATPGTLNLYLWSANNPLQLLTPGETEANTVPDFEGASPNFSQLYLTDPQALLSGANAVAYGLYEWKAGALSLVSVLPGGTASQGDLGSQTDGVNQINGTASNAVSSDGSKVFWSDESAGGGQLVPIYLYTNGASTEITTSQCTRTGCPTGSGDGVYWTASTDGTYAFFTSPERLTNDSTARGTATFGDLYVYDTATGVLSDLTVDPTSTDPRRADVQGVIGASGDGSYVYFVANGVLASGATPGQCGIGAASTATCNLYVWHGNTSGGGTVRFISTVSNSDSGDWGLVWPSVRNVYSQVSPDGLNLIYTSVQAPASGYQNAGHTEIYLFNATSDSITCVSCRGLGGGPPAQGNADLAAHAPCGIPFPGDCFIAAAPYAGPNNITSDGTRVFFDSSDQLTPGIVNATDNVFEWQADGTGDCVTAGGCVYLLSGGDSPDPSEFLNATPTGGDVFILTREQLLPQDVDDNVDVYDARIGGGFPAPSGGSTPPCTDVTSCRGPGTSSGPASQVAATVTFVGPGNGSVAAVAAARVRILRKRVRGTAIALRVEVPQQGLLGVAGNLIPTHRRYVGTSGTYRLYLTLTKAATRKLERKHKLKFTLRISYTTGSGTTKATVKITVVS